METTARFSFRPAAARGHLSFELTSDGIARVDAAGEDCESIVWSDIQSVRFSRRDVRLIRFAYLDICSMRGSRMRISCSAPSASWDHEPDSRAFCDLVAAVVRRLAELGHASPVVLGDGLGWRIAWFVMGLAMASFGASLPIVAYLENVDADRLLVVAPVMAIMALLGVVLAWTNRPWRRPPALRADDFLTRSDQILLRST